ncbi:MAG TPA: CPBP family intramembrane metalloprotease [Erwinia persicina]|uniref:CPBP family intramembrane metalloprotease n=1 Tax=Erwinia persicina TaxID=55211 RepID=A0A3S7S944_9GAMM|nr:CPBP family intramembrane glutamic endopeptidase [Erwinia persicina]AXU97220.1 CPBP family intramembrane metalloprotease [Erwinia persicina]MBC3947473.1 CPBP family intramembrane metalloprotease [Erwinia persicina]MBD8107720.1 CPBP family intramembrane metalloprotease [Erwinia persicina]MBD8168735.1 CPBP family intramembrane metalloprotease [Erwinia persicina]MBD8210800.1 CPBP family intramembrane metalloprotease [Erwinia persicina]
MWYTLAASLLFLPFYLRSSLILLAIALGLAVFDQTLLPPGMVALAIIGAVALYCGYQKQPNAFSLPGEIVLVVSAIALMLHMIPGFNNLIIVSGERVGPQSVPFTFYYNIDKALIPFLLLACLPTLLKRPAKPPANALWWLVLMMSLPLLLLLATVAGGLRVEPHLPDWLGAFMLANLFFVSLAEEALFRGYIQQRLSQLLGDKRALFIAALLFGFAHFSGGLLLVLFATLAGLIYGLAWLWSGRLWVSTLVHFAFNMLHLLFFTYPMWQRIPT